MPVNELAALFTSARAAYDIAQGIGSLKAEVERNESVSKILEILLSVQSDTLVMQQKYQTLLDEKQTLTDKLMHFEDWKKTETEYELFRLKSGSVVRVTKAGDESAYHKNWLCATCFERKQKSYLQRTILDNPVTFQCAACKSSVAGDD